jgi:hypothetical protein
MSIRYLIKLLHCRIAGHDWSKPYVRENFAGTATLTHYHCRRCHQVDRRISAHTLDDLIAAKQADEA